MPYLPATAWMMRALCAMAGGLFLLMPTKAEAVQIFVTDQNGTPISNVNLCISTPEFGIQKMTDRSCLVSESPDDALYPSLNTR